MLCEDCGKEDAAVKLTQIIESQKTEINLCLECAKKRGWKSPLEGFPLAEFLASMVQMGEPKKVEGPTKGPQVKCSLCGITFEDFSKQGRLGCGNCYKIFREQIKDLLRKIHGSDLHRGKIPLTLGVDMAGMLKEERKLQEELKKAIADEDFELAAHLRDRLKSLMDGKTNV